MNLSQGSILSQPGRGIHVVDNQRPEVNELESHMGPNSIARSGKIHSDSIH
jgi:hypothetical protein